MPSRFEAEAAATAAGTLPLAITVKPIEDWMVEGRQPRKMIPDASAGGLIQAGRAAHPRKRAGNRTEGEPITTRCHRQWITPRVTAAPGSRPPSGKNTKPMESL